MNNTLENIAPKNRNEYAVYLELKRNGIECLWLRGSAMKYSPDFVTENGLMFDAKYATPDPRTGARSFSCSHSEGRQNNIDFFLCLLEKHIGYCDILVMPEDSIPATCFYVTKQALVDGVFSYYINNYSQIWQLLNKPPLTPRQRQGLYFREKSLALHTRQRMPRIKTPINLRLKGKIIDVRTTQRDIATKANIPESHLSLALHGKYNLSIQQQDRIAEILGCGVNEIF